MKLSVLYSILIMLFLTGCSTTYNVREDPEEFGDLRGDLYLKSSTVRLLDGREISLDSTVLLATSVVGVTAEDARHQELPLSQVQEISTSHVGRGAWRGTKKGLLVGTSIGLVIGVASPVGHGLFSPPTRGDALMAGGVVGALGGLCYGAIAGMVFMSTEHYQFNDKPASQEDLLRREGNSRVVTLRFMSPPEETADAVRITWEKRTIWLPKSRIVIERIENGCVLSVPEQLLEK
jgi:hypothetical protein